MAQKITPNLWFDKEAVEAAEFYTSIFPDSGRTFTSRIKDTPSGDCDIVSFELMGYEFRAISAGPHFKPNPSISFIVNFDPKYDKDARKRIDEIWDKLSEGGKILMSLDTYSFSERYGWIQDKYGVSWQILYQYMDRRASPSAETTGWQQDPVGNKMVFEDTDHDGDRCRWPEQTRRSK